MSVLSIAIKKVNAYKKSRTSTLIFYQINKNQEFMNNADLKYKRINSFEELVAFSDGQGLTLKHLINKDCKNRFETGSYMVLAIKDNKWVSYGWVSTRGVFWIAEIDIVINADCYDTSILYDFVTRESCRGKGYYPTLLTWMANNCDSNNCIIYCYDYNYSSIMGVKKAGGKISTELRHSSNNVESYFKEYGFSVVGSKLKIFGLKYNKYNL